MPNRSQPFIPSPVKKRDRKKTQTVVHLKRVEQRQRQLKEQLANLLNPPSIPFASQPESDVAPNGEERQQDVAMDAGEGQVSLLQYTTN